MKLKHFKRAMQTVEMTVAPWKIQWENKDKTESFSIRMFMRPTSFFNSKCVVAEIGVRKDGVYINVDIPKFSKNTTISFNEFLKLSKEEVVEKIKAWVDNLLEENGYILVDDGD